jgi:septation ring formation regulator EzrA
MSDLEGEQDKSAALNNTLNAVKGQLETVTSAKDVAEARVKQLQSQLVKANEASAQMATQMEKLKEVAEVGAGQPLMSPDACMSACCCWDVW